jgi:GNAT superfamily N-acetyltransferase
MPSTTVHDCTPDRWDDVVAVFEGPGDPGRCWCQWFYRGAQADRVHADVNRAALHEQVAGERPPGVLGYVDSAPLGWCAVAPRSTYTRLARSQVLESTPAEAFDDPAIWSVTCFVVRREARREGLSAALLDGAVDLARRGGAAVVEGYPVDVEARNAVARNRPSAASLYHGTLGTFLRAGFEVVATPSPGRAVVRLTVQ